MLIYFCIAKFKHMKRIFYLVTLFLSVSAANAQTRLNETFPYLAPNDTLTSNGWVVTAANTTNVIRSSESGLSFSGYVSGGSGNAALVKNTGQDIYREFSPVSSGSAYCGFLANIITANTTGDYFFALLPNNSTSNLTGRLYIRNYAADTNYFQVAISKSTEATVYAPDTFPKRQTLLFMVKYTLNTTTTTDDSIRLYISKAGVPATEPANAIAYPVNPTQTDAPNIARVVLRQGTAGNAPTLVIDGLRVGHTWNDAPLPVKWSDFTVTAGKELNMVKWSTAAETNNSHFIIERSNDGDHFDYAGTVKGKGHSTQLLSYSYADNHPKNGNNYYRIKQVDLNGNFIYSKTSGNQFAKPNTDNNTKPVYPFFKHHRKYSCCFFSLC